MFPYQTNPRLKDKNSRVVARVMSYESYTCRKKATRLHRGKSGDIFYRIRKSTKILVQLVNCYVQHEVYDTTNISPERLQKCRSGHEWEANPSAEDPRKGHVFLGWTPGAETGEEGKNHNRSRFVRWLQGQQPAEGRYRVCKPLFDVKLRDWPIRLRLILCHVPPFAFLIWPCTHFIRYRGEPQIRHFPANAVVPACQWNLCGEKRVRGKKELPRSLGEYTPEEKQGNWKTWNMTLRTVSTANASLYPVSEENIYNISVTTRPPSRSPRWREWNISTKL